MLTSGWQWQSSRAARTAARWQVQASDLSANVSNPSDTGPTTDKCPTAVGHSIGGLLELTGDCIS